MELNSKIFLLELNMKPIREFENCDVKDSIKLLQKNGL